MLQAIAHDMKGASGLQPVSDGHSFFDVHHRICISHDVDVDIFVILDEKAPVRDRSLQKSMLGIMTTSAAFCCRTARKSAGVEASV